CNHKGQVGYYSTTTSAGDADDWQNPDSVTINPGGGAAFRAYGIKFLRCPSDSGHEVLLTRAFNRANFSRMNYACNAGPVSWAGGLNGANVVSAPFAGNVTYNGAGPMVLGYGISLGELTNQDGTSNTALFNEVVNGGQVSAADPRGVTYVG